MALNKMDPVATLKDIAIFASTIATVVDRVNVNKARSRRLASRINSIVSAISSFQTTLLKNPTIGKTFSAILGCLNQYLNFIREFEGISVMSALSDFRKHGEKFSGLNSFLNTCAIDLNLEVGILNLQETFNPKDDQLDSDSDFKSIQGLLQEELGNTTSLLQEKLDVMIRKVDAAINNNEISDLKELTIEQQKIGVQMNDITNQIESILNLMAQFNAATLRWWKETGRHAKKFIDEKLFRLQKYITSQQHTSTMLELKEWIQEQKNHPDEVKTLKEEMIKMMDYIRHWSSLITKSTETLADVSKIESFQLSLYQRARPTKRKTQDPDVKVQNSESMVASKRRSVDVEPTDPEEQFKLGVRYANGEGMKKDEAKAVYWYQKAADQGYARAKSTLGFSYDEGRGIKQDRTSAFYWYQRAAVQGDVNGQYNLGSMYLAGRGIEKDEAKAVYWYQKAAEQGDTVSQSNLGGMYAAGRGVEKDEAKAVYWFQKAADQGDVSGEFNLGVMYAAGRGIEKDDSKVAYWFQKAADQGHAGAQINLGAMYDNGRGVERDEAKAVYWYQKAADQGSSDGQFTLGTMYDNGRGVERDEAKAVYWYQKAAYQGSPDGQFNLGFSYANGQGVGKDEAEAIYWYSKAADQGDAAAQASLGISYAKGRGVEQDQVKSVYWCQKAADQGNAIAQFNLGGMYTNGRGVEKNDARAAYWYQKAADQGNVVAQNNLGDIYANGCGIEKDEAKAVYWYQKSADQGDVVAQRRLAEMQQNKS